MAQLVNFARRLSLDWRLISGTASIQIYSDTPAPMALRYTVPTVAGPFGRRVDVFRLPGSLKGKLFRVVIIPSGPMTIYARPQLEVRAADSESAWGWINLPGIDTPSQAMKLPLPITPTPQQAIKIPLPMNNTPEQAVKISLPMKPTPDQAGKFPLPIEQVRDGWSWVSLPVEDR